MRLPLLQCSLQWTSFRTPGRSGKHTRPVACDQSSPDVGRRAMQVQPAAAAAPVVAALCGGGAAQRGAGIVAGAAVAA